jgi:ZIP family zinc transporter
MNGSRTEFLPILVNPETHCNGHQTPATLGLMGGFAVMMFLDTALA